MGYGDEHVVPRLRLAFRIIRRRPDAHRARLSPIAHTRKLTDEEIARLHAATRDVLIEWTDRLRAQTGEGFPEKVTGFRPEMAAFSGMVRRSR